MTRALLGCLMCALGFVAAGCGRNESQPKSAPASNVRATSQPAEAKAQPRQPPEMDAAERQAKALEEVLSQPGHWRGPYGEIIIDQSQRARVDIELCIHEQSEPGVLVPGTKRSCQEVSWEGARLREPHRLGLQIEKPRRPRWLGAYIDEKGMLHVGTKGTGMPGVSALRAGRKGQYPVSAMHELEIDGDRCRMESRLTRVDGDIACKFVERGGRLFLDVSGDARFGGIAGSDRTLLLLPDLGIIVDPMLDLMVFKRVPATTD